MRQSKQFFYFNGFNSAILEDFSDNSKIVAVADFAERKDYRFMPVSIRYRRAGPQASEVLAMVGATVSEVVFCGSSMGGWFARILQLMLNRERPEIKSAAIGFNPAYDLREHGHMLLGPQQNHVTLENYEWTADHGMDLHRLEAAVDYDAALPFFVYLDKGDELIGWEHSAQRHSPISRVTAFEGGCHSFDHYHEALADFGAVFTK
ncbi:MAG: hypothetical protein KJN69_01395 [Gammaproteobacteria bacterium]|nr:hypothetical protein [Gammaproteobacteria bacterium]MBT8052532.1 hypothetical protein [Gammaproteobacteria bacterium]